MGIAWGVSIVVLTPPLWWGVMEAVPLGDAYSRARLIFDQTGEWPAIAIYDRKAGQHKGLVPAEPHHRDKDTARALAEQARADAVTPEARRVRTALERCATRLQAEADFDMRKGAALWR